MQPEDITRWLLSISPEQKPSYSVVVRFKQDEKCPCPAVPDCNESHAYWSLLRGTRVTLIHPAVAYQGIDCETDIHWRVRLSPELERLIALRQLDIDAITVCRHMLDIGD